MTIKIIEPATFPSDDPANIEVKDHRRAYLVSFDPQLLSDRVILLEERLWHAQRAMTVLFDYPPEGE